MYVNNSASSHVLRISCFNSRKDTVARPLTMTWKQLVGNLTNTRRTAETMKEWDAMTRDRRGAVKDVGGFTGGIFADGRRGNKTTVSRSCVTLDLDNGSYDPDVIIKALGKKLNCAVCGYSTHSHRTGAPKIRLVIPLAKEIDGLAYETMTRQLVKDCGLTEYADPTTHQRARLFYWPSASKDAPVWHRAIDGAPLLWNGGIPASAVTPVYGTGAFLPPPEAAPAANLHDVSKPLARLYAEAGMPPFHKAGMSPLHDNDPRRREGIVGRFCTEFFPIGKAIDRFLGDIYTPCANGRYAYRDAHSEGGLVILDGGLYAYSHHANTDPAGRAGRPFNAWDLVQLHLFGDAPDAFRRMTVLARKALTGKLPGVPGEEHAKAGTCQGTSAVSEAGNSDSRTLAEDAERARIRSLLDCKKGGYPISSGKNARIIMTCDPKLSRGLAYNLFEGCIEATPALPWFSHTHPGKTEPQRWSDMDFSQLMLYVSDHYDMQGRDAMADAASDIAIKNPRHPVRTYLESLRWDGTPRLDTAIIRILGAADTDANREMTRLFFIGAVGRVMKPGIKFDYMPILKGPQGCYKSTFFSTMFHPWFSDSLDITDDKDTRQHLTGAWGLEIGELAGIRKAPLEQIKRFITQAEDRYRPPYARNMEVHPRQCVFAGTTNSEHFLVDDENRRFFVITIEPSLRLYDNPPEQMKAEKDQLWAEAYHLWQTGWKDRPLVLSKMTAEVQALENQSANINRIDPLREAVYDYIMRRIPKNWDDYSPSERRNFYRCADSGRVADENLVPRKFFSIYEMCAEFWGLTSPSDAKQAKGKMCSGNWQKKAIGYLKEIGRWENQGRRKIRPFTVDANRWVLQDDSEYQSQTS